MLEMESWPSSNVWNLDSTANRNRNHPEYSDVPKVDFHAPPEVIRTARDRAPTRTSGENWGRSFGYHGDEDSSTSGYGSALLYVRKGLGRPDIVGAAVHFIREVQYRAARRWTLVPLSHGWDDGLMHLGTDTPMRRDMPGDVVARLVADTCAMAGEGLDETPALLTTLFPPTDFRSLYQGKTYVERGDLLVFVDHTPPLFGREPHETAQRMWRQVVLMTVAMGADAVRWGHLEDFERGDDARGESAGL